MRGDAGLLHIYCGLGKGKTTAAAGLALRALGHGLKVVIVQFLKDASSGEMKILAGLPGARVLANPAFGAFGLSDEQMAARRDSHTKNFLTACALCADKECDLLILDEVVGAIRRGLFDEAALIRWLSCRPAHVEVALTGREPSDSLLALADYVSRIEKIKHPYDRGAAARIGVEK